MMFLGFYHELNPHTVKTVREVLRHTWKLYYCRGRKKNGASLMGFKIPNNNNKHENRYSIEFENPSSGKKVNSRATKRFCATSSK
jgi:hypothetical protein